MSVITDLIGKFIPPQTLTVGGKTSSSSQIPVKVTLNLDPDFKKTLVKSVAILTIGIGAGIATGIIISNSKRKQ